MNRTARVASGVALALVVITCTDRDLNGPRYHGQVGLNLSAFRNPTTTGGQPPIPIDSVSVVLTSLDGADDYDTTFAFGGLPYTGGAVSVSLAIPLKHASQVFGLGVTVKGQGYTWYVASDTVTVIAGKNSSPNLLAKLVGPGSNAGLLFIGPQDSTVIPGLPVLLYASVSDSFEGTLTGVPVGFRLQNPALGIITYPTYLTPVLIPVNPGTKVDTTWLIGETPNHILDSTQIYITPKTGGGAPALIYVAGGDAQVDTPKAVLPLPLQTLVTDANGIPAGLAKVVWARTGFGSFVGPTDTTVADSFGFAKISYQLGTSIRTDTITASLVGFFAGPPPSVFFTATSDTGFTLAFDTTTYILGKSQVSFGIFVTTRLPVSKDLTVQIGRSDSTALSGSQKFGLAGTSVFIPAGQQEGCCVQITGNNLGSANLIAHATGYPNATANVIITTPMFVFDSTLFTYENTQSVPVLLETADSTGAPHYTANDLVIRDSSADTTIAKPDSTSITIPAGNFLALAYIGGVKAGSTTVTFRASNYAPAVTSVTVDTAFLVVGVNGVGLGQVVTQYDYMYLPAPPRVPVKISLTSSNPSIFTVPDTVMMFPDSSDFIYFPVTGVGRGTAFLTVRAPGFVVSDSVDTVTVSTPRIQPNVVASVSRGVKTQVYVYAEDSTGFPPGNLLSPVTVHVSTNDPNGLVDSGGNLTIPAGQSYDSIGATFNSTGQFTVTATAPGYLTGTTLTNAAAPPVGVSATPSPGAPMRIKVVPIYPDSLRRKVSPRVRAKPAPPRR